MVLRYCETLKSLQQELEEFQKQLDIEDPVKQEILQHLGRSDDASLQSLKQSPRINWRYEWERIRVSWARDELLQSIDEIDRLNKKLGELQGNGEKLQVLDKKFSRTFTVPIQKFRKQASSLYDFLAKQWPCQCPAAHSARIYLRQRPMVGDRSKPSSVGSVQNVHFEISMAVESSGCDTLVWKGPLKCVIEEVQTPTATPTHIPVSSAPSQQKSPPAGGNKWDFWKKKKKAVNFQDKIATAPQPMASALLTPPVVPDASGSGEMLARTHSLCMDMEESHTQASIQSTKVDAISSFVAGTW